MVRLVSGFGRLIVVYLSFQCLLHQPRFVSIPAEIFEEVYEILIARHLLSLGLGFRLLRRRRYNVLEVRQRFQNFQF